MSQSKPFIDAAHALNDLSTAIARLENENAKLRELCETTYRIAVKQCLHCPYRPTGECDGCAITDVEQQMKELGIKEES